MRLHIEDTYTYPRASRDDLQRAFDSFEDVLDLRFPALAIGDLDMATALEAHELEYTAFLDCADGLSPGGYLTHAAWLMGSFTGFLAAHNDLPHEGLVRRLQIIPEDGAWRAADLFTS